MILTIISEHEEAKKVNKELEDSRDNDNNNQAILKKMIIPSDLNYIQTGATHVCNAIKLGLVPTEDGASSSLLTSYFKLNKCGKFKLENENHSGAPYLSSPDLMGNASCHP